MPGLLLKRAFLLLTSLTLTSLLAGCQSDSEDDDTTPPPSPTYYLEATIDNQPTTSFNYRLKAQRSKSNGRIERLLVSGSRNEALNSVPTLDVEIKLPNGDISVGSYYEGATDLNARYIDTTNNPGYDNDAAAISDFVVIVTQFNADATTVKGTFSGTLKNAGNGQSIQVTGRFFAPVENFVTLPPPTPTGPGAAVDDFVGDWLQNFCATFPNATSARNLIRVSRADTNKVNHLQGVVQYANTTCQGAGSLAGPSPYGSVLFDATAQSTSTLSARWGMWSFITGSSHVIWAKKGSDQMCILGDESPTLFATAESVENHLNLDNRINQLCYTRR